MRDAGRRFLVSSVFKNVLRKSKKRYKVNVWCMSRSVAGLEPPELGVRLPECISSMGGGGERVGGIVSEGVHTAGIGGSCPIGQG